MNELTHISFLIYLVSPGVSRRTLYLYSMSFFMGIPSCLPFEWNASEESVVVVYMMDQDVDRS